MIDEERLEDAIEAVVSRLGPDFVVLSVELTNDPRTVQVTVLVDQSCEACGRDPAAGFALVGAHRYCHDGYGVSCYSEYR